MGGVCQSGGPRYYNRIQYTEFRFPVCDQQSQSLEGDGLYISWTPERRSFSHQGVHVSK